jgi:ABC-type dipeptide/oligopeptide/nickel transport system permease component
MPYILKKTLTLLITLLLVSFLAFLTFQIIPGDPVTKMLGTEYTPERAALLRAQFGLDAPFLVRYLRWLGGFVRGDMGLSYTYMTPVNELLIGKLSVTAMLSTLAFVFTVGIAVPFGIWLASRENTIFDRIFTVANQVTMSIPPFFLGIVMTLVLGLILHLFTPGAYVSYAENPGASLYYLIFPAIAIAVPKIAMTVKLLKSSIGAEYRRDYFRTALSRGNTRRAALYTHALRNAATPVITFLAMTVAEIAAGSIVVEQVFTVPGLGRLLVSSIQGRDFPVVCAIVMLVAALVIIMNFLADILCRIVDPRLKLGGDIV